jgi:hypothetical protein
MQAKICQNTFIHSMLVLCSKQQFTRRLIWNLLEENLRQGASASESDLSFRVKYQRAFEAVLWSLPAVANYRFRMGGFSHIGYNDNAIVAYSAPVSPKFESLTADPTEPFIGVCTNLKRGPVVLEVPAAMSDLSLSGQVIDAWQLTIAEIGPSGLDKGRASKYLITGPDFNGPIPRGISMCHHPTIESG